MSDLKFGQRFGFEDKGFPVQFDSLNTPTRNDLYNAYHMFVHEPYIKSLQNHIHEPFFPFHKIIWQNYFRKAVDEIPYKPSDFLIEIKYVILESDWFKVYNLFEFLFYRMGIDPPLRYTYRLEIFKKHVNHLMISNNTAWRLNDELFVPVTNQTEIEEIAKLKENTITHQLATVAEHLSTSLKLLSSKPEPDLRNSIKESISMVGVIARLIGDENDLGRSLIRLEKRKLISPSLSAKFKSFYNYTSDKGGIRHELMDEQNLSLAEARYFLIACSAFSNYLIDKAIANNLFTQDRQHPKA